MQIHLLSLFPEVLLSLLRASIVGRAQKKGIVSIRLHDLRRWGIGSRKNVDDRPFGGGAGMLLRPEPIAAAIGEIDPNHECRRIYLCPDGQPFCSTAAKRLACEKKIFFLSGHYEGVDERIREKWIDEEISLGDYVLTNGVIAAAVLIDAITRQIDGVLGNDESLKQDSFEKNLLTFPQYTRPEIFEGASVPKILLSGNHKKIDEWRRYQQIMRTKLRRKDLGV